MTRARPDTAAAWVARLGSDQRTRADEAAFDAWLTADPAHAAQYAEHAELWDGLGALTSDPEARAALLGAEAGTLPPPRWRCSLRPASTGCAASIAPAGASSGR